MCNIDVKERIVFVVFKYFSIVDMIRHSSLRSQGAKGLCLGVAQQKTPCAHQGAKLQTAKQVKIYAS